MAGLGCETMTLKQETPEAKVTEEAAENLKWILQEPSWMIQAGTNIAKQEHRDINRRVAQPLLCDTWQGAGWCSE